MPRKMSDRWLAANKENAKKSTGPKTSEGKARCAQNASKHGILAKEVVVKDGDGRESTVEFAELVESLHAQFQPQDAIEHVLVDRVAACYWRLRRAQRYEVGAVREGLDSCKTPLNEPGPNMKKHEASVRHYQMMLDIDRHLDQEPKKGHQSSGVRSPGEAPNAATDKLDQQAGHCSDPAARNPAAQDSEDPFAKREVALRKYADLTEFAEKQDALADSRRPLLGALPADESLNRLIRYETMLDRQLHRALSELRRRRQMKALRSEPGAEATGPDHPNSDSEGIEK